MVNNCRQSFILFGRIFSEIVLKFFQSLNSAIRHFWISSKSNHIPKFFIKRLIYSSAGHVNGFILSLFGLYLERNLNNDSVPTI